MCRKPAGAEGPGTGPGPAESGPGTGPRPEPSQDQGQGQGQDQNQPHQEKPQPQPDPKPEPQTLEPDATGVSNQAAANVGTVAGSAQDQVAEIAASEQSAGQQMPAGWIGLGLGLAGLGLVAFLVMRRRQRCRDELG